MIKISPSLLAADSCALGSEAEKVFLSHADELHYDVMDGHFVPNLSFGPHILAALKKKIPDLFYDVHLMLSDPLNYVDSFASAGANLITIHAEANQVEETLRAIREHGLAVGLSVKPKTPVETILPYLDLIDRVLLMTVEPGFGGQKMMPEVLLKAEALRKLGFKGEIEADGGINSGNMHQVIEAGVNVLVMGTGFFRSENPEAMVQTLHQLSR